MAHKENQRKYRATHIEQQREATRQWRASQDPEERKAKQREAAKQWRLANPKRWKTIRDAANARYRDRHPDWKRKYRALHEYGLSLAEYNGIKGRLATGPCDGCNNTGPVEIDHTHTDPPAFRGLLCHACNVAIGSIRDDADRLERLAKYIRRFKVKCLEVL